MGNHQSNHTDYHHFVDTQKRGGFVARKRQKLEELKTRRQSMPLVMQMNEAKHSNFTSFAYGDHENTIKASTPRIQINGQESTQASTPSFDSLNNSRHQLSNSVPLSVSESYSGLSVDLADNQMQFKSPLATNGVREESGETSPPKRHRFIRNPKSAATRRMEFLSFTNNFVVRSLDETAQEFDIEMKPLSHRARSLSPLKQLRTYSFGSIGRRFPSDECVLAPEHCQLIRESWKSVNEIIQKLGSRPFGFLVLNRVFQKMPLLRNVFKVEKFSSIDEIPSEHSFIRHIALFNSIIDLAVRNVEDLQTEIAPVVFIYGRRHFTQELNGVFNEETVRLFCGQVVCTVLDILGATMSTDCMEAWIEFMRYLGKSLLNGFEYEALNKKNKFTINTKDHAFFIA